MFKCELPVSPWGKSTRNLCRFNHKSARATHRIKHGFVAVKSTLAQEKCRHSFTHWSFTHGFFVTALMKGRARGVEADGALFFINADHYFEQRIFTDQR